MYLTDAETQKVEELAAKLGIEGAAENLVKQAMEAVLAGKADEVAYGVTEAAGVEWITPYIWHRRRNPMNAELARAILAQGRKDGTHEAPIPEADDKAIADAEELIEMARTAWDQHVRGPEVEVLLKMAAEGNGGAPKAEEESPPEEEKPEQKPPEEPSGEEPVDLTEVEPWDGYAKEPVAEILAATNAAFRDYETPEFRKLMANLWAFEAAHKARATIIDHLENIARRLEKREEDLAKEQKKGGKKAEPSPEETVAPPEETPESQEEDQAEEKPQEAEGSPPPTGEEKSEDVEKESEKSAQVRPHPVAEVIEKRERLEKEAEKVKAEAPKPKFEEEDDDDYLGLRKLIDKELDEERIHKPSPPKEKVPDLPWDWTKMSNGELQQFHGMFSVIAYYKGYILTREERIAIACKMAADDIHNAILVKLPRYDERDKEKRVALIEAEVESDENIKRWRRRQRKHETFAAAHRNERDSIGRLVDALSRHESMRHQEWERSGKLGQRGN